LYSLGADVSPNRQLLCFSRLGQFILHQRLSFASQ